MPRGTLWRAQKLAKLAESELKFIVEIFSYGERQIENLRKVKK